MLFDHVDSKISKGVYIRIRSESGLSKLAHRPRAATRMKMTCLRELLSTEYSALLTSSQHHMQHITDLFVEAATSCGVRIHTTNTIATTTAADQGELVKAKHLKTPASSPS